MTDGATFLSDISHPYFDQMQVGKNGMQEDIRAIFIFQCINVTKKKANSQPMQQISLDMCVGFFCFKESNIDLYQGQQRSILFNNFPCASMSRDI